MHKMNRAISTIVLTCFLFNTAFSDLAFGLATPLVTTDIVGIQHKDMGRISFALQEQLKILDRAGKLSDTNALIAALNNKHFYEQTIFQPAGMQFFWHEPKGQIGDRHCYRVVLKDKDQLTPRVYYVLFSLKKSGEFFPVDVITDAQYKESGELAKYLPQHKAEDTEAVRRYVEHEKTIDAFIRERIEAGGYVKIEQILSNRCRDLDEFLLRLKIDMAEALRGKQIIAIRVPDSKGFPIITENGRKITVRAHTSANAVYLFLDEKTFDSGSGRWNYEVIDDMVVHEIGVAYGLPYVVRDDGRIMNDLDSAYLLRNTYDVKTLRERFPRLRDLKLANLDHVMGRDYAAGNSKLNFVKLGKQVAAKLGGAWTDRDVVVNRHPTRGDLFIAGLMGGNTIIGSYSFSLDKKGNIADFKKLDEIVSIADLDKGLEEFPAGKTKTPPRGKPAGAVPPSTSRVLRSPEMGESAGTPTEITAEYIDKNFTRPDFVDKKARITKVYGEIDNYAVCRYEMADKSHYIVVYDKTTRKCPRWFTDNRGYPLQQKGRTNVELHRDQGLISVYNSEMTGWDDNGGFSEHYLLCDTKTGRVIYDGGSARGRSEPENYVTSSDEKHRILLVRGVNSDTRYSDGKGGSHEAYLALHIYDLAGKNRGRHSVTAYDFSRDKLTMLQSVKIVGGSYLQMEYLVGVGDREYEIYDIDALLATDTLPQAVGISRTDFEKTLPSSKTPPPAGLGGITPGQVRQMSAGDLANIAASDPKAAEKIRNILKGQKDSTALKIFEDALKRLTASMQEKVTVKVIDIAKAAGKIGRKQGILYRCEPMTFDAANSIIQNGIDTSKGSIYYAAYFDPEHAFKDLHFNNTKGYTVSIDPKQTATIPRDARKAGGLFIIAITKNLSWFDALPPFITGDIGLMVNHYKIPPSEIAKLYLFNPETAEFEEFRPDTAVSTTPSPAGMVGPLTGGNMSVKQAKNMTVVELVKTAMQGPAALAEVRRVLEALGNTAKTVAFEKAFAARGTQAGEKFLESYEDFRDIPGFSLIYFRTTGGEKIHVRVMGNYRNFNIIGSEIAAFSRKIDGSTKAVKIDMPDHVKRLIERIVYITGGVGLEVESTDFMWHTISAIGTMPGGQHSLGVQSEPGNVLLLKGKWNGEYFGEERFAESDSNAAQLKTPPPAGMGGISVHQILTEYIGDLVKHAAEAEKIRRVLSDPRYKGEYTKRLETFEALLAAEKIAKLRPGTSFKGKVAWFRSNENGYTAFLNDKGRLWLFDPQEKEIAADIDAGKGHKFDGTYLVAHGSDYRDTIVDFFDKSNIHVIKSIDTTYGLNITDWHIFAYDSNRCVTVYDRANGRIVPRLEKIAAKGGYWRYSNKRLITRDAGGMVTIRDLATGRILRDEDENTAATDGRKGVLHDYNGYLTTRGANLRTIVRSLETGKIVKAGADGNIVGGSITLPFLTEFIRTGQYKLQDVADMVNNTLQDARIAGMAVKTALGDEKLERFIGLLEPQFAQTVRTAPAIGLVHEAEQALGGASTAAAFRSIIENIDDKEALGMVLATLKGRRDSAFSEAYRNDYGTGNLYVYCQALIDMAARRLRDISQDKPAVQPQEIKDNDEYRVMETVAMNGKLRKLLGTQGHFALHDFKSIMKEPHFDKQDDPRGMLRAAYKAGLLYRVRPHPIDPRYALMKKGEEMVSRIRDDRGYTVLFDLLCGQLANKTITVKRLAELVDRGLIAKDEAIRAVELAGNISRNEAEEQYLAGQAEAPAPLDIIGLRNMLEEIEYHGRQVKMLEFFGENRPDEALQVLKKLYVELAQIKTKNMPTEAELIGARGRLIEMAGVAVAFDWKAVSISPVFQGLPDDLKKALTEKAQAVRESLAASAAPAAMPEKGKDGNIVGGSKTFANLVFEMKHPSTYTNRRLSIEQIAAMVNSTAQDARIARDAIHEVHGKEGVDKLTSSLEPQFVSELTAPNAAVVTPAPTVRATVPVSVEDAAALDRLEALRDAMLPVQRNIEFAASYASKAGVQIPTHPSNHYNLLITAEFFASGELDAHKGKYGDRFILDAISGRTPEQFVDNILAKANGKEVKTIALVPNDITRAQLERLASKGIRFVRVDTMQLLKAKSDKDPARAGFQTDTYAMLLLLRQIDDNTQTSSPVYRLLEFYLKTHFDFSGNVAVSDYIKAITKNDIGKLLLGILAYRPAKAYDVPEYKNVAASLISA